MDFVFGAKKERGKNLESDVRVPAANINPAAVKAICTSPQEVLELYATLEARPLRTLDLV